MHFSKAQLANPAISGPQAAPAGDGVANLLKYHLGLGDPWVPAAPSALPGAMLHPDADTFVFTYWRDRNATDSAGFVEWSETLAPDTWFTEGITTEIVDQTDTHEAVEATVPLADRLRLFMRLRVEPIH
jgi:hypothetical protein